MDGDLYDIVNMDWPSVKAEVQESLYDDDEPMTVAEFSESIRRVLGVSVPLGRWGKFGDARLHRRFRR
jgi:hypothetical protein